MTKADIINEIAEQTGLQRKEVSVVVEAFMETVKRTMLDKKENVYLRGFGSFIIKHSATKTARDIGKDMTITIAVAGETLAGERRVALVPETAKKFTGLGAHIRMEQGAGKHSQFQDNEYLDVPTAANLAQTYG